MENKKVIIEMSGKEIIAIHASEELEVHIVDWDAEVEGRNSFEEQCKAPVSPDRMIDKKFDYYMNEIINT